MADGAILPDDSDVELLLCENARQEARGKVSLLGFFAGRKILVDKGTKLPTNIQLSAVYIASNGSGEFEVKFQVQSPSGNITPVYSLAKLKMDPSKSTTLMFEFSPFIVDAYGTYTFNLTIDNKTYVRHVEVTEAPNS